MPDGEPAWLTRSTRPSQAAQRIGVPLTVLDPAGLSSPAGRVSGRAIEGSFTDAAKIKELAAQVDVITVEIEHVDAAAMAAVSGSVRRAASFEATPPPSPLITTASPSLPHSRSRAATTAAAATHRVRVGLESQVRIHPSPAVIALIQDKARRCLEGGARYRPPARPSLPRPSLARPSLASPALPSPAHPRPRAAGRRSQFLQKQHFAKLNGPSPSVPIGDFEAVGSAAELVAVGAKWGYPLMLKARKDAYDGRGNAVVGSAEEAAPAFEELSRGGKAALYVEAWCPFEKELAVMVVRDVAGRVVSYPVVETTQRDSQCHSVLAPAQASGMVSPAWGRGRDGTRAGCAGGG